MAPPRQFGAQPVAAALQEAAAYANFARMDLPFKRSRAAGEKEILGAASWRQCWSGHEICIWQPAVLSLRQPVRGRKTAQSGILYLGVRTVIHGFVGNAAAPLSGPAY